MAKTAVVVCPGRGTYTKTELGYLAKHMGLAGAPFVQRLDARLAALGEPTVQSLDAATVFSLKTHTPGEYASTLIYACSAVDFMAIDRDAVELVAITGNSMGWYTALALAEALQEEAAFQLIHGMGSMMRSGIIGGQLIYPVVDAAWRESPAARALVEETVADVNAVAGCKVYRSIHFGGYAIIGGNEAGLTQMMQRLPPVEEGRYPFILVNHAAFHTPLLRGISELALERFGPSMFRAPKLPLIDGRGAIWQPHSTDPAELHRYTLGHQVYETYDFSRAIEVALKEFAPDYLILLGPGSTSGGALGQILISQRWHGLDSKEAFTARQAADPVLIAMARPEQAALVRAPVSI